MKKIKNILIVAFVLAVSNVTPASANTGALTVLESAASEYADLISLGMELLLSLVAGLFTLRIAYLFMTGQVELVTGKPGALADIVIEVLFLVFTAVLAIEAPTIIEGFLEQSSGLYMGPNSDISDVKYIFVPIASILLQVILTLSITIFFMSAIMSALQTQISSLLGSANGVSQGLMQFGVALFSFTFGLLIVRAANQYIMGLIT